MKGSRPKGSGTIIIMAWGRLRPARWSSSRTLSKIWVSEPSTSMAGRILARSSPKMLDRNVDWRANTQFTLPRSVLISPLWLMKRYGCARPHDGKVFVEKRLWTRPMAVA
jgi:hypothetical protein